MIPPLSSGNKYQDRENNPEDKPCHCIEKAKWPQLDSWQVCPPPPVHKTDSTCQPSECAIWRTRPKNPRATRWSYCPEYDTLVCDWWLPILDNICSTILLFALGVRLGPEKKTLILYIQHAKTPHPQTNEVARLGVTLKPWPMRSYFARPHCFARKWECLTLVNQPPTTYGIRTWESGLNLRHSSCFRVSLLTPLSHSKGHPNSWSDTLDTLDRTCHCYNQSWLS